MRTLAFDNKTLDPRVAGRRVIHPAQPWRRPPPREVIDLSGLALRVDLRDTANRRTVPSVIDRFVDADLVWSDCFLLGQLFQNTYYESGDYYAGVIARLPQDVLPRRLSGIHQTEGGLAVDEAVLDGAIEVREHCLFATPSEPHHWGLFLTSSMPAIAAFQRERSRFGKLFLHCNHANMRATLGFMGITADDILDHKVNKPYRFASVEVPRTPHMNFHVYPEQHAMFRALALRHGEGPSPKRIFVSRATRSREGYRRLVNEDELLAAMEALGLTIVEPELLPAAAQMRLFAEAEVIVGLGGGSLFNAVFSRPGTRLLDIERSPFYLDRHANLFASLGLDYSLIIGAPEPPEANTLNGPWRLDVAAALPHITRFLAG